MDLSFPKFVDDLLSSIGFPDHLSPLLLTLYLDSFFGGEVMVIFRSISN